MQFLLDPTPRTKKYKVESATRIQQSGKVLEYHELAQVELALLGKEQGSWIFRLVTHSVQINSNNDIFAWARDVNALLNDLVLQVDLTGYIRGVLNHDALLKQWPAHRQMLQRIYGARIGAADMLAALDQALKTPAFLQQHLTTNGLYDFLFPGLYGEYNEPDSPTLKILSGFFGLLDLPLALHRQVAPATAANPSATVSWLGQVDERRLDEAGFRRFLKDATDSYNIKTDLLVDYEATYQLDSYHWPTSAELFLTVNAGGTAYAYTLGRQLTLLP